MSQYNSFRDFYPFYLGEHSNLTCRRLHFAGTTGIVIVAILVATNVLPLVWLWAIPILGYGFAWVGHFFFEKNRPATFKYPFYSLLGDWVMYKDMLTGKIRI